MSKQAEARQLALEDLTTPAPESLFEKPVEYVFFVHYRLRTLCQLLDEIALTRTLDFDVLEAVLDFLKTEMGPHILDEEEDLFPLLRRRAEPEDDIHAVLGQLCMEHEASDVDAALIISLLETLKASGQNRNIDDNAVQLLNRFAANERRHLIVENAIVLPLARVRLTDTDRRKLGQRMAARRGVVLGD